MKGDKKRNFVVSFAYNTLLRMNFVLVSTTYNVTLMKNRLENLEKKIIASDRNQPRIYLTKQEAGQFDLARPVLISIEQEDYPVVDSEIVEYFNQKLSLPTPPSNLVLFIIQLMTSHNFEQVARNEENIAFGRTGKYLNWNSKMGFNTQLEWLKTNAFRHHFILDSSELLETPDFVQIIGDLLAKGLIKASLIALEDGSILYRTPNWDVEPNDVKQCLYDWQFHHHRVKLQNIRYSILLSQPEYFSALNRESDTWLVGATTSEHAGKRYFILGKTESGADGKNAYVDVARTAQQFKKTNELQNPPEPIVSPAPLSKMDYFVMIALEKQLGMMIPIVKTVENMTFGCVVGDKHIIALGLYHKNLTSLPENIGDLTHLRELYVCENRLKDLPESIGRLKMLTVLNVNSNELTTVPESIGNLTALTHLNLCMNHITTLPATIGGLTALKALWLQQNTLLSIPENIGQLSLLNSLNLSENRLQTIPASIGQLKNLKILILNRNPLTSLPEPLGNLSMLEDLGLDLDRPEFIALPESLLQLSQLKSFDIGMFNLKLISETTKKVLRAFAKQGCLELPYLFEENRKEPGKNNLQALESTIIHAWESLSLTVWDEAKKNQILGLIKSGEPYLLGSPKIRDIKYRLVQNGYEYERINKWQKIDEKKDPEFSLKSLVDLHDHLESRKDLLHPSLWSHFKESIASKSKKFQALIPFTWI